MTRTQLEEIRSRMEEEHRQDREALARLMRFIPENGDVPTVGHNTPSAPVSSVLGRLESILHDRDNRTWTAQQLKTELLSQGFDLKAKNPIATIGVALKKLADRGKLTVVSRGSGREPNVYQWRTVKFAVVEEEEP